MITKLQHQRIQHLQFELRQAKRELKRFHGRQQEVDVSWAQHELQKAEEEAKNNPAITLLDSPETAPTDIYAPAMGIAFTVQEFVHA